MIYRVIISHNQTEHLEHFPVGAPTVVVLDAPTEADLAVCQRLGFSIVLTEGSGNRGHNRSAGFARLQEGALLCQDDVIEFLDGDRCPTQYDAWSVNSLMSAHGLDVLLYTCGEHDARHERIYVPLKGATLVDPGTLCNPFYSCGFAIRVSAAEKICTFNGGPLFEPRFTKWGCEDQYMGLTCAQLGFRVALTAEILLAGRVGGDSYAHDDYKESLQQYINLIKEKNFAVRNDPIVSEILG